MTEVLEKIARGTEKLTTKIAMVGAWAGFALVFLIVFDVIARRFFDVGSSKLQELEWHLHTIVFMFCLGWGYLAGAHVRIAVLWERMNPRTQNWIEIVGCLVFLFPFVAVLIFFGWQLMADSFAKGEISAATTGLLLSLGDQGHHSVRFDSVADRRNRRPLPQHSEPAPGRIRISKAPNARRERMPSPMYFVDLLPVVMFVFLTVMHALPAIRSRSYWAGRR